MRDGQPHVNALDWVARAIIFDDARQMLRAIARAGQLVPTPADETATARERRINLLRDGAGQQLVEQHSQPAILLEEIGPFDAAKILQM